MITSACDDAGRHAGIASIMPLLPQVPRESRAVDASPTFSACIIDCQSVKSAEKGAGIAATAFDAGKLQGKKRHDLDAIAACCCRHRHSRRRNQDRDGGSRAAANPWAVVSHWQRAQMFTPTARGSGTRSLPRPGRHPARSARPRSSSDPHRVKGFVDPAQALGGRTHHRLVQPLRPWPRTGRTSRANSRSPSITADSRPFKRGHARITL